MTPEHREWLEDHHRDYGTFDEAIRVPLPEWFAQEHRRYLAELYEEEL